MSTGLDRAVKRVFIRTTQSARIMSEEPRSPWVRRFYALLAPAYDLTFLNLPGFRQAARDLIERLEVGTEDAAVDVGCSTAEGRISGRT